MNIAHPANNGIGPSLPRGLAWVLVGALAVSVALASVFIFSRGREKGENYVTLEVKAAAQTTGRDPCEILKEWLADAKREKDTEAIRAIQQAQKFLGCRNIQKRSQGGGQMSWYAAHAVMLVKFKDEHQDKYPFWENVILVEAQSDEEAFVKAAARARLDEGDSRGTFTWEGRPACWHFAGIRKLVACEEPNDKPNDGTEVTYLEMEIDDHDSFTKFMNGEPVLVRYG